jgi:hypothetical protein
MLIIRRSLVSIKRLAFTFFTLVSKGDIIFGGWGGKEGGEGRILFKEE